MLNLADPLIICCTYFPILFILIKLLLVVMFMCCKNDSLVINLIESGQQLPCPLIISRPTHEDANEQLVRILMGLETWRHNT